MAAVRDSLNVLTETSPSLELSVFSDVIPRELKSASDETLEKIILCSLQTTGLDILSEETGLCRGHEENDLSWVVDPLDGTVNFVRGIAPCGVSIALCQSGVPIWGVVGEFPSGVLYWGGPKEGAFREGVRLRVSTVSNKRQSIVCSGFPSRFEFDQSGLRWISEHLAGFAKVRMLGSASQSLLAVARGAVEAYTERNIMLWDVAAGLAIVEGAGGLARVSQTDVVNQLVVFASNGILCDDRV